MNKIVCWGLAVSTLLTAQAQDWVYNSSEGTVTDGGWTFAATVANETELTVGSPSADPGEDAELDFSKPITDGGTTTYTLVKLNPVFSSYANKANLASLVLPTVGLVEISKNAFNGCTALTNVVNYIPDSVTKLGKAAFQSVPAAQALRVYGVADIDGSTFRFSGVTSVYFGPALKSIYGSYNNGAFQSCTKLTNLTFDAGITGAAFTGTERHFDGCSKLKGTIDLSGFSSVLIGTNSTGSPFGGCTKVSEIIFGSGLTKIGVSTIAKMTGLKKVTFKGKPPTFYSTPSKVGTGNFFYGFGDDLLVATYVPEEYASEWGAYEKDGKVNAMTSCWATPWANAEAQASRPLIYKKSGGGGKLGDWVYDSSTMTITNGAWKFSATCGGARLVIGSCLAAPASVSRLDFTQALTDEAGNELIVVGLNTAFNGNSAAAKMVGELILTNSITAVSANAFNGCTALTNIVPYLPDSVTTVGGSAFRSVPAAQALRLQNVATIEGGTFYGAGITSIHFGPALKTIYGSYNNGAFQSCTKLTNLTFDAAITGAAFTGSERHFDSCTKLTGTIDLRGFKSVKIGTNVTGCPFGNCLNIKKFVLGEELVDLGESSFTTGNNAKLHTVEFWGPAPKFYSTPSAQTTTPKLYGSMGAVTTLVHYAKLKVPVADGFATWLDYVEKGDIGHRHGTWTNSCVASGVPLSNRPLWCPDMPHGLILLVR